MTVLTIPRHYIDIPSAGQPGLTLAQIEAIARAYCDNRTLFDAVPRHYSEHVQVAEIFASWYYAFESVLRPARYMVEGDL